MAATQTRNRTFPCFNKIIIKTNHPICCRLIPIHGLLWFSQTMNIKFRLAGAAWENPGSVPAPLQISGRDRNIERKMRIKHNRSVSTVLWPIMFKRETKCNISSPLTLMAALLPLLATDVGSGSWRQGSWRADNIFECQYLTSKPNIFDCWRRDRSCTMQYFGFQKHTLVE